MVGDLDAPARVHAQRRAPVLAQPHPRRQLPPAVGRARGFGEVDAVGSAHGGEVGGVSGLRCVEWKGGGVAVGRESSRDGGSIGKE